MEGEGPLPSQDAERTFLLDRIEAIPAGIDISIVS
jgi:hypothetical protein